MPAEKSLLLQARNAHSGADCKAIYHVWADTYNNELADPSHYAAPFLVSQTALESHKHVGGSILDAGCGTGLVGEGLARGGASIIDGLDFSSAMLKKAEQTGVYRRLILGDLTQRVDIPDEVYDIVTCCGTFTHGHVGPEPALREFVRVTKKGGIIVATVIEDIWASWGYKAEIERLEAEALVKVVSVVLNDYVKKHGDKAMLVVLEKSSG